MVAPVKIAAAEEGCGSAVLPLFVLSLPPLVAMSGSDTEDEPRDFDVYELFTRQAMVARLAGRTHVNVRDSNSRCARHNYHLNSPRGGSGGSRPCSSNPPCPPSPLCACLLAPPIATAMYATTTAASAAVAALPIAYYHAVS